MRLIFFLAMFFCKFAFSQAQQRTYEGPAKWLPITGATEKYTYQAADTNLIPQGEYLWKLSFENRSTNSFELAQIKSFFRNGKAHGDFEFIFYTIQFDIIDFDAQEIKSRFDGTKSIVKGKYIQGKPDGLWQFNFGKHDAEAASTAQLSINTGNGNVNFKSGEESFSGKVNKQGFFDGRWTFQFNETQKQEQFYQQGILTGLNLTQQSFSPALWPKVLQQIEKADSIVAADQQKPYIWNPGFAYNDSLLLHQNKSSASISNALQAYTIIHQLLKEQSLFDLPVIKGTARVYFSLTEAEVNDLNNAQLSLSKTDSLLKAKMNQPVFQLRRAQNKDLDQLLNTTEGLIVDGYRQQQRIRNFLQEETRFVIPQNLLPERNLSFDSHTDYTYYLLKNIELYQTQVSQHEKQLLEMIELLRQQGTIEDMETEWVFLKEAIDTLVKVTKAGSFPEVVYQRYVMADFDARRSAYAEQDVFEARKSFLREAISYYDFFHRFYKHEQYNKIIAVEAEFIEKFTKFLYNPYMGVDNVEVLVKKNFLQHMLNNFWPYLLEKLQTLESGAQFQIYFLKVLQYKDALLYLADDYKHEAKRLERRGRKENNMKVFEELVNEYTQEVEEYLDTIE
ncbi:MAG TPA: hypothetical protein PKC24_03485 [Cyclobacteriaceae bacterium]|nr:hypothetical protein [Cyclobacteriaceae bacterium]